MGSLSRPQLPGITRVLRRIVQIVLALALAACTSRPDAPAPVVTRRDDEPSEPISIRRGTRELRLRCALTCDAARAELARQQRACASDPTSTPHAVSDAPPMIALGCCTEAEGAYREACGVEGLESCVSRWSAECASGRLTP